eukprot:gene14826-20879_t
MPGGSGQTTGNAPSAIHLYVGVPELSRGNLPTNAQAYGSNPEPAPSSRGQLFNALLGSEMSNFSRSKLLQQLPTEPPSPGNSPSQFLSSQPAYMPNLLQQQPTAAPQELVGGQNYWQLVPCNFHPGAPTVMPNPPELHTHFAKAVDKLGVAKAIPKNIMKEMNVEGLTRENVSSHLQKYRILQKEEQKGENGQAAESGSAGSSGSAKESAASRRKDRGTSKDGTGGHKGSKAAATKQLKINS